MGWVTPVGWIIARGGGVNMCTLRRNRERGREGGEDEEDGSPAVGEDEEDTSPAVGEDEEDGWVVGGSIECSGIFQFSYCRNWLTKKGRNMVGFKNRYMVVEVNLNPKREQVKDDPITLTPYNVTKAIKDSILLNFGECGLASSVVKYVNAITKVCIIRASREEYQKVWAAITMMRSIANIPVVFNLLDLSGSIKACKNAALKCEESKFEQHKLVAGGSLSPEQDKKEGSSYLLIP
ncbi:hypothetical protein TIFTF001_001605 [Ficus carica]|uniref:Uncharacterized protein n=1 Tax=Ficus carica TaxID=3494 RepID=A0AA87ZNX7_FICCA|nr:hypothetical protein TIFTF001_001605 [Ficus carica]